MEPSRPPPLTIPLLRPPSHPDARTGAAPDSSGSPRAMALGKSCSSWLASGPHRYDALYSEAASIPLGSQRPLPGPRQRAPYTEAPERQPPPSPHRIASTMRGESRGLSRRPSPRPTKNGVGHEKNARRAVWEARKRGQRHPGRPPSFEGVRPPCGVGPDRPTPTW